MKAVNNRLFFIDAMRAWAILMMLQGHFVDGLLDPVFRDSENFVYKTWLYFRGITAPVFFTVSGFIFTFLLIRAPQTGWDNPRVKKGIRRGLQLLLIGYALRLNLFGLFQGHIYDSFYLVDVLHCIGLAILTIIGLYLFSSNKGKAIFPLLLVGLTLVLFLFEPLYKQWSFSFLPNGLANYLTKANGSVFTIIPWLGYTTIGAGISLVFYRFRNSNFLYPTAIATSLVVGLLLIFQSSPLFFWLHESTQNELFLMLYSNNYLFIRLGDVFVVFAVFMIIRKILTHKTLLSIGSSTLSIYVIHFIILYGSFTGLGLYKFFHHELNPWMAISGAAAFMIACTFLALQYNKHEVELKDNMNMTLRYLKVQFYFTKKKVLPLAKTVFSQLRRVLVRFFATAR